MSGTIGTTLGRLEQVPLRKVWTSEARDFTPWLAQEANLAVLSEALDLRLEVEAVEKRVGPFRADLLCKDIDSDTWVLVENQLEWTDHTHLGQLLTYASGLDAVTLVWIAERFTDEHRAVLDWLNDVTDERIRCFGLEVEVWRIGDSAAAPKFNLVSKPNGWTKQVAGVRRTAERSVPSTTKLLYQEYWSELNEVLARSSFHLRRPKPQAKNWTRFSTGQPGTRIYAFASAREGYLGVELILNRPGCAQLFEVLQGQRPEIESEIGQPLEWTEHPGSYRIVLRQNGFDPTDRVEWGRQHTWFVDRLKQYDHVFLRRIAKQPETMKSD